MILFILLIGQIFSEKMKITILSSGGQKIQPIRMYGMFNAWQTSSIVLDLYRYRKIDTTRERVSDSSSKVNVAGVIEYIRWILTEERE